MTKHEILFIPNPKLREQAQPVQEIDAALQQLIDEMFEVMYNAEGVGLAATQIGIPLQLAVLDVSRARNEPLVLINPVVKDSKDFVAMKEGCLSVPGHVDTLSRAKWVRVKATDRDGQVITREADGLLAECIQHEVDHLHGKLYIDYLPKLRRQLILKKVQRYVKKR